MPSLVHPIAPAALAAMQTRQLLALRDRLLACEESLAASDAEPHEIDPATIRFKDDPRWGQLYAAVKAVLATREHVPRGRIAKPAPRPRRRSRSRLRR